MLNAFIVLTCIVLCVASHMIIYCHAFSVFMNVNGEQLCQNIASVGRFTLSSR